MGEPGDLSVEGKAIMQVSGLTSYVGAIRTVVWRRSLDLLSDHIPIETAMIITPFCVSMAWWALDKWAWVPFAENVDAAPHLIVGAAASGLALLVIILLVFGWNLFWAPVNLAKASGVEIQELRGRVAALEEEREPKITVSTASIQAERGDAAWALLRVENTGVEPIEDCYCRLVRLEWRSGMTTNGVHKYHWSERFANEEIYFRWRGQDPNEPHRSFRKEAVLEIVAASPSWSQLANVGDRGFQLIDGDPHKITLEIGAKNSPARIETFGMRMQPTSTWIDSRGVVHLISSQPPPRPIFEKAG